MSTPRAAEMNKEKDEAPTPPPEDQQTKEQVHIRPYDYPPLSSVSDWPDGSFLADILTREGGAQDASTSTSCPKDAAYWRALVRWALLRKFAPTELPALLATKTYHKVLAPGASDASSYELILTRHDIETIQTVWDKVSTTAAATATRTDLHEWLQSSSSVSSCSTTASVNDLLSNKRPLQWAIMDCPAGSRFRLHAHPNIEFIYCLRGSLHEVRMQGPPLPRQDMVPAEQPPPSNDAPNKPTVLQVTSEKNEQYWTHLSWTFGTVSAGQCLVNEVGSVHQSFTSTAGNCCRLLVWWGGSHANVPQGSIYVQDAVVTMDDKLTALCQCRSTNGRNWAALAETFLPMSERRQPS